MSLDNQRKSSVYDVNSLRSNFRERKKKELTISFFAGESAGQRETCIAQNRNSLRGWVDRQAISSIDGNSCVGGCVMLALDGYYQLLTRKWEAKTDCRCDEQIVHVYVSNVPLHQTILADYTNFTISITAMWRSLIRDSLLTYILEIV